MATYCTVEDVRAALTPGTEVPNSGPDASQLPDWQIIDAIDAAEGVVNTFVAARYAIVPADAEVRAPVEGNPDATAVAKVAPAPIRAWTRDIAAYYATLTFRRSKNLTEDDPIRLRMKFTVDLLTDVRDRKSTLPLPAVAEAEAVSGVAVVNLYEGVLFGPEDFNLTTEHGRSQHFIRSARWNM